MEQSAFEKIYENNITETWLTAAAVPININIQE